MPELPEVEVLVRHLRPLVFGKRIRRSRVFRAKFVLPTGVATFENSVRGARFVGLARRGKYLIFQLKRLNGKEPIHLLGHLGMTGRIYLASNDQPLPKHTAVVFEFNRQNLVFEDTRYFGRMTFDLSPLDRLGPEPLSRRFTLKSFAQGLARSSQAIKVKLLDQSLVSGVGNIYASEALFRAGIAPALPARKLTLSQVNQLQQAIRSVLRQAIKFGSTVPLNHDREPTDGLFYFGLAAGAPDFYEERLQVYDRLGQPCYRCGTGIVRIVQAARSTFYCPNCQPGTKTRKNPLGNKSPRG